jgi:hypothetical protein
MADADKPKRQYFKTYLKMLGNAEETKMFQTFYVSTPEQGEFDALGGGYNSCAFFVSSVLVIFDKIRGIHGTVNSTIKDLQESGWQEVKQPKPGDVLVWEPKEFSEGPTKHIGFYLGHSRAVSTSIKTNAVVVHEFNFGEQNRKVEQIYRTENWDGDA